MAGYARKCVRGWLKNAIVMSCARRVFQKVTAGVSPVKQSVRQNEMGMFWGESNHFVDANKMFSNICCALYHLFTCDDNKKIARMCAGDVLLEITGSFRFASG